jgi:hypothetical protein
MAATRLMNIYVWWLSRPAYVAGAAVVAVALYLAAFGLGWADDVDGTVWTFGRVSLVLASGVAAGLRDVAALALIVITDENGGIGPWLTAGPSGPHWAAGRTAWAVLAFAGAVAVRAGLRDPSAQQRVQVRAGAL